VYDDANQRRTVLASTPNTHEVVVIDADTAQFRSIAIADPVDRILLFPDGGGPPRRALFASVAAGLPRLHVLSLDHLDDPLAQPVLTPVALDKPVRDVVAVPGRDLAMIVHNDARTVLGLLDLDTAATSPLLGVGKLDAYDFLPDGSHLIGATTGIARVGFVALDNLHPTDFRLDDLPSHVLATANNKIFVDHGGPFGHATIRWAVSARSATARSDPSLTRVTASHTASGTSCPTTAATASSAAVSSPRRVSRSSTICFSSDGTDTCALLSIDNCPSERSSSRSSSRLRSSSVRNSALPSVRSIRYMARRWTSGSARS